jgi:hypothetical protein
VGLYSTHIIFGVTIIIIIIINVKGKKVKFLCSTNYALPHEGVWGSGCIHPHFLDLGYIYIYSRFL